MTLWKTMLFCTIYFLILHGAHALNTYNSQPPHTQMPSQSSNTFAGTPLWTITPLTSTNISIPKNGRAIVEYLVTNQSRQSSTLAMLSMQGVTQITQATEACDNPFTLATFGSSCRLSLKIEGNQIVSPVLRPKVCKVGSTLQCYQPKTSDIVHVTVTEDQYSVGGTVSGLTGIVTLQNNGTDTRIIATDGNFKFSNLLDTGSAYAITVRSQPIGQTCTVDNGVGTIQGENITNVTVTCSATAYTVGGTVSGLSGTLILLNNGGDDLTITNNAGFTFPTPIATGSTYDVTIKQQPANQTCTVSNGFGRMENANVTNVTVTCSDDSYTVGGNISGLSGSIVLLNNDTDALNLSSNGSFTFSTKIAVGATYTVSIQTQPAGQICSIQNGTGTMGNANVTNVIVSCQAQPSTSLSVSATGIIPVNGGTGSITVTNTGSNPAYSVQALLPGGWSGVTQNASNCTTIPGYGTCTLSFTSTQPYIAEGNILISGDNIPSPPATALAFTVQGFLVFAISDTTVDVIDASDLPPVAWGSATVSQASSLTDGFTNTNYIYNTPNINPSAAVNCYNSTSGGAATGTWYLPAICQLGGDNQGAGCDSGLPNIDTNLFQLGFGGLISAPTTQYWSSTYAGAASPGDGWVELFKADNNSFQAFGQATAVWSVRCVRSISLN